MQEDKTVESVSTDIAENLTGLINAVTEDDDDLRTDAMLFLKALATALSLLSTVVQTSIFKGIAKNMVRKALVKGRAALEEAITAKLQKLI